MEYMVEIQLWQEDTPAQWYADQDRDGSRDKKWSDVTGITNETSIGFGDHLEEEQGQTRKVMI